MHPHRLAGLSSSTACSRAKKTSTHSPSVQPSFKSRSRSCPCPMHRDDNSVSFLANFEKTSVNGQNWESPGATFTKLRSAGVPASAALSSSDDDDVPALLPLGSVRGSVSEVPLLSMRFVGDDLAAASSASPASSESSSTSSPTWLSPSSSTESSLATSSFIDPLCLFKLPTKLSTPSSATSFELPGLSSLGTKPMIRAGLPTAVAPPGIGLSTTLSAPILALSPTVMFPSIFVPAPISTSRPILGWRSPFSFPVPPSVTPCRIVVLSPTVAVSPMTTPVAWSNMTPHPIEAAGCMSTPKADDA
mmetsp:Transcript_12790/g.27847  ORF Transcript_12790/g.27847 Transcript_12790/m.27847 type:complete len:304 (-) Transcript_12790:57-968(-)